MPAPLVPRACVLVCDSWGIGDAPDADAYGDDGANTLSHVAHAVGGLTVPALEALGLGCLAEIEGVADHAEPGTGTDARRRSPPARTRRPDIGR